MKKLFSLILGICTLFTSIPNVLAKGEKFHVPVFGDDYEKQRNFICEYVGYEKAPDEENDAYTMYKYISKNDIVYFYNINQENIINHKSKIKKLLNLRENICSIVYIDIDNCSIEEMREKTTNCALTVKSFNKDIQLIAVFHDVFDIEKELQDEERCKMLTATKDCIRDIEYDYLKENPGVLQFRNQSHFPALKLNLEKDIKRLGKLCYSQIESKERNTLVNKICTHPVASGTIGLAGLGAVVGTGYGIYKSLEYLANKSSTIPKGKKNTHKNQKPNCNFKQ